MRAFFGLVFGLTISLVLAKIAGESPVHVLNVILQSAIGSPEDLAMTLFYTTSLIFTGLSVSIAFHAGLFNIGAEGQLYMGALAATIVGLYVPAPYPIAAILALAAAVLVAGIWGMIPGVLKAYRGSHEVIVTMMMNFTAAGICSWLVLGRMKNPYSQNPESSPIQNGAMLRKLDFGLQSLASSPFNSSFFVAIALSIILFFFLYKTVWGYEIRAVGFNQQASEISGIRTKRIRTYAMFLAGALAGLVAMNEILGSTGKFRIGFSPDYGFTGIAVALLARNNPLNIMLSAFLFAVLHKGAVNLDIETNAINKDFAKVIQAIIVFSVAGFYFYRPGTNNIFTKVRKWIRK